MWRILAVGPTELGAVLRSGKASRTSDRDTRDQSEPMTGSGWSLANSIPCASHKGLPVGNHHLLKRRCRSPTGPSITTKTFKKKRNIFCCLFLEQILIIHILLKVSHSLTPPLADAWKGPRKASKDKNVSNFVFCASFNFITCILCKLLLNKRIFLKIQQASNSWIGYCIKILCLKQITLSIFQTVQITNTVFKNQSHIKFYDFLQISSSFRFFHGTREFLFGSGFIMTSLAS